MSKLLNEPIILSRFFNALSSKVRLDSLQTVSENRRPFHIKALANHLKLDYAAVYRHVIVLRDAALVDLFEVGRSKVVVAREEDTLRKVFELASSINSTWGN